jgi:hypothetical protein
MTASVSSSLACPRSCAARPVPGPDERRRGVRADPAPGCPGDRRDTQHAPIVRVARVPPEEWDAGFREPWLDLLTRLGAAVLNADVDKLREARADLTACADHLVPEELHDLWPVYGALLVNLRNIMDALSAVAEAQPVQAASPLAPRQPVG